MKISQREAHRLRKRVRELEQQENTRRNAWAREWPGGVHIGSLTVEVNSALIGSINTARLLKHAVVATHSENGRIEFRALPLGKTL